MRERSFEAGHPWMLTPLTFAVLVVMMTTLSAATSTPIAHAQGACSLQALTVAGEAEDGYCNPLLGETAATSTNDCVDHSTVHTAYYAEAVRCPRGNILAPTSIAEAQRMVRQSVSQGLRIKVVGHGHSNTDILCADSGQVVITTEYLQGIGSLAVFEGVPTMRVEPGVGFSALQVAANAVGYSTEMNAPGYGGITVIGGLATGLHGGSPTSVSSISHKIVSVEVIDPSGALTTYTRGTTGNGNAFQQDQWRALLSHLGLLGFIAAVRVELVPQFGLDTVISDSPADDLFADVGAFVEDCDYAFTHWFPFVNRVKNTCGMRVAANLADPTAWNGLFTPDLDQASTDAAVPGFQAAFCSPAVNALVELARYQQTQPWLYQTVNGTEVTTDHLIGLSHRITTLPDFREGQPRFSSQDWEVAVPQSREVQTLEILRDELSQMALPLIGMVIRYDYATDDTILGANAVRAGVNDGERIMHVEIPTYVGYMATQAEKDNYNYHVLNALHEIILTIPEARFHWGKNREDIFSNPTYLANNAAQRARFQAVIDVMDPYGVFSNEWARRSGFTSPLYGQNFANYYFPSCATPAGAADSDNDGLKACTENLIGSSPSVQNGMYARIINLSVWDGSDISGGCHNYDNWNEIKSWGQFGSHWLFGNQTREQRYLQDGWEFDVDSTSHNYRNSNWNFLPSLTSGGTESFGLMFSANMNFAAGTYCFSNENESPGTAQDTGWNSCSQTWVDKNLRTEVGYNANPRTPVSCQTLSAGNHRIDFVHRFQGFLNGNSFAAHPRWCQASPGGTCTPNREFERHLMTPVSSL
ncbi:MAG: FAD-binding protein [Candidatus Magasanikbacteria bacterium]|nr:FAD-binding protein [Candidatus Magasanikbacteria bacterium]